MPSPRMFKSPPIPTDILSDLVADESSPKPIVLDKEVMGPFKTFIIPNISKPTRFTDDDLHALVRRTW